MLSVSDTRHYPTMKSKSVCPHDNYIVCPTVVVQYLRIGSGSYFCHGSLIYPSTGMVLKPFYGASTIHQLECSGDTLDAGKDLLTLVLYEARTNVIMAYVNTYKDECLTWDRFSSCLVYAGDSRRTRLRSLVPAKTSPRTFGCNVTVSEGGQTRWLSWTLVVKGTSES